MSKSLHQFLYFLFFIVWAWFIAECRWVTSLTMVNPIEYFCKLLQLLYIYIYISAFIFFIESFFQWETSMRFLKYIWLTNCLFVAVSGLSCSVRDLSLWPVSSGVRGSCPRACGILVPRPGIKPRPPALQGRCLTTGPEGKSLYLIFYLILQYSRWTVLW